jgi:hypothetical protein
MQCVRNVMQGIVGALSCIPSIVRDECIEPARALCICCCEMPPEEVRRVSFVASRRLYRTFMGPKQTENPLLERITVAVIVAGVTRSAKGTCTPELGAAIGCCCCCSTRFCVNAIKAEVRKWEEERRQPVPPVPPPYPAPVFFPPPAPPVRTEPGRRNPPSHIPPT